MVDKGTHYICVNIVHDIILKIYKIYTYNFVTVDEVDAYRTMEFNAFDLVFKELSDVLDEAQSQIDSTEASVEECKSLATPEEGADCFSSLHEEFSVMKDDVLSRLAELYELDSEVLRIAEERQQLFHNGNRQFVRESAQVTRNELTRCIQRI